MSSPMVLIRFITIKCMYVEEKVIDIERKKKNKKKTQLMVTTTCKPNSSFPKCSACFMDLIHIDFF